MGVYNSYIASFTGIVGKSLSGCFSQLIIAKGYVYPLASKHGSISKKTGIGIEIDRLSQKILHFRAGFFF